LESDNAVKYSEFVVQMSLFAPGIRILVGILDKTGQAQVYGSADLDTCPFMVSRGDMPCESRQKSQAKLVLITDIVNTIAKGEN